MDVRLDLSDTSKCISKPLMRLIELFDELRPGEECLVRLNVDAIPLEVVKVYAEVRRVDVEVIDSTDDIVTVRLVKH